MQPCARLAAQLRMSVKILHQLYSARQLRLQFVQTLHRLFAQPKLFSRRILDGLLGTLQVLSQLGFRHCCVLGLHQICIRSESSVRPVHPANAVHLTSSRLLISMRRGLHMLDRLFQLQSLRL